MVISPSDTFVWTRTSGGVNTSHWRASECNAEVGRLVSMLLVCYHTLLVKRGKDEFPCPTEHAGWVTAQCEYLNSEPRVRRGELTVVVAAFLLTSLQCSVMQGADGLSPSPAKRSNTGRTSGAITCAKSAAFCMGITESLSGKGVELMAKSI